MKPLLTIITVTYNCEDLISTTVKSVLEKKPQELEYIVIDGQSSDRTLEKIANWRQQIDQIISEKDDGIYDAMNKGLRHANGEYILYINAGDELFNASTLSDLIHMIKANLEGDVFYGDTMLVDDTGMEIGLRSVRSSRFLPAELNWKSLKRGMVVSHQSFIVRKSIAPFYDLQYRSSSDIDWVIKCLKKANCVINTNLTISRYLTGGFSKQQHPLSLRERYHILQHHYGFISNISNHLIILLRGLWFRLRGKSLN